MHFICFSNGNQIVEPQLTWFHKKALFYDLTFFEGFTNIFFKALNQSCSSLFQNNEYDTATEILHTCENVHLILISLCTFFKKQSIIWSAAEVVRWEFKNWAPMSSVENTVTFNKRYFTEVVRWYLIVVSATVCRMKRQ